MAVFIGGVIGIVVFYLLILLVGLYAARKNKVVDGGNQAEEVALASRNIGWIIGPFTMIATWVGGGYINGTAEAVFMPGYGLSWAQAPWGFSCSLFIGGIAFAKVMRDSEYLTMLDPFQDRYGSRAGGLLYIVALSGEVFWSAAILAALGSTVSVVLELNIELSVIVSACIAVFYTLCGGLYSVAYTDVIQLLCIFIGLWLSIPFAMNHEAVTSISLTTDKWIGELPTDKSFGYWIDLALLLVFGGIPWQVYFQRVLSSKTARRAQLLSILGSFGCIFMAIPAVIIGAIAASTDWSKTGYSMGITTFNNITNTTTVQIPAEQYPLVLPLVLRHLTPKAVAFFGLGGVSAAVMSSSDSSILSASSMFAINVYKPVFRPHASPKEIVWVIRAAIVGVGFLATLMALTVKSVYGLFLLCADLVYVVLFPQLVCVVYTRFSNTYGCYSGYIVGLVLRLLGGEPLINLKPTIIFPLYDAAAGFQNFPFRTLSMCVSFATILIVSYIMKRLHEKGMFPDEFDVLKSFQKAEVVGIENEIELDDEDKIQESNHETTHL